MIFEEAFIVKAPHQEAWEFFTDFPSPILVIPDLIYLRREGPNHYAGAGAVRIGPFQFRFEGHLRVMEVDPATFRVNMLGEAEDPVLGGHFRAMAYTQTLPYGPDQTRVSVRVQVGIGGLLGKLGKFLLTHRASRIVEQYGRLCNETLRRRRAERALAATRTPAPGSIITSAADS